MKTTVIAPVTHLCPHKDEIDYGELELTFGGPAVELHDLRKYLNGFYAEKVTHEDLVQTVADNYECHVIGRFATAGMQIVVTAGPWL